MTHTADTTFPHNRLDAYCVALELELVAAAQDQPAGPPVALEVSPERRDRHERLVDRRVGAERTSSAFHRWPQHLELRRREHLRSRPLATMVRHPAQQEHAPGDGAEYGEGIEQSVQGTTSSDSSW